MEPDKQPPPTHTPTPHISSRSTRLEGTGKQQHRHGDGSVSATSSQQPQVTTGGTSLEGSTQRSPPGQAAWPDPRPSPEAAGWAGHHLPALRAGAAAPRPSTRPHGAAKTSQLHPSACQEPCSAHRQARPCPSTGHPLRGAWSGARGAQPREGAGSWALPYRHPAAPGGRGGSVGCQEVGRDGTGRTRKQSGGGLWRGSASTPSPAL